MRDTPIRPARCVVLTPARYWVQRWQLQTDAEQCEDAVSRGGGRRELLKPRLAQTHAVTRARREIAQDRAKAVQWRAVRRVAVRHVAEGRG